MCEEKEPLSPLKEEDDSLFAGDGALLIDDEHEETPSSGTWIVMIVDDDESVHAATKYALQDFLFFDKGIEWLDAFSAREAMLLIEQEAREVALIFLDVVMESDTAGLDFLRWLRARDQGIATRVILRTGQPGQAPEREVIVHYDLHDYKTKTELTSEKLFTTTVAALRAYHGINRLETTKVGLENIISATSNIFKIQNMYEYARAVLMQIECVLDIRSSGIICARKVGSRAWEFLARSGEFLNDDNSITSILNSYADNPRQNEEKNCMVNVLGEVDNALYAIYVEPKDSLNDIQTRMLLMFCNNVSVGISNIKLNNSLLNSHKMTVMGLAQVTESRDRQTGEHVFRIAHHTEKLTRALRRRGLFPGEIDEAFCDEIGLSSTLHDVGKVAIRDAILLKPGPLTDDEMEEMKKHSEFGAQILDAVIRNSGVRVAYLEMSRRIAMYHHERWDGAGYPEGLAGAEIPIEARITALADVFDALTHKRCYKDAYSPDEARSIIREGRGSQFDPEICGVFLDLLDSGEIVVDP